jgi:transcriptional regulator with XRE-family HTH domain
MGTAARIRGLRIRAGKSQAEMSQRLGLNPAWYSDLEKRDDELASTLTIFKAMELASIFGVTLHELLDEPPVADERIALMELPILFFQALAAALRINWLALVPDENET